MKPTIKPSLEGDNVVLHLSNGDTITLGWKEWRRLIHQVKLLEESEVASRYTIVNDPKARTNVA